MSRLTPDPPGASRPVPAHAGNPQANARDTQAPIREYGAIGDGRTVALIASDGSIDWLCLPNLDSPSVFGALLDQQRGGRFQLAPKISFRAQRRYLPATNVLETTYDTDRGRVRVTDAMALPRSGLAPQRELVRRVERVGGEVPMRWRIEPRFATGRVRIDYPCAPASRSPPRVPTRSWSAPGTPEARSATPRRSAPSSSPQPARANCLRLAPATPSRWSSPPGPAEARLDSTIDFWRSWADSRSYDGPWPDAVIRSALVLKLLVHAPSGAIAAAATTSLGIPIGGLDTTPHADEE